MAYLQKWFDLLPPDIATILHSSESLDKPLMMQSPVHRRTYKTSRDKTLAMHRHSKSVDNYITAVL